MVDALRRFDDAESGYEALGLTTTAIFPDRCEVLISAGLASEALAVAESAVRNFSDQGNQVDAAESLLLVGRAALLAADYERAREASDEAVRSFAEQGREGWDDAARVLSLEARLAAELTGGEARGEALELAVRLRDAGLASQAVTATRSWLPRSPSRQVISTDAKPIWSRWAPNTSVSPSESVTTMSPRCSRSRVTIPTRSRCARPRSTSSSRSARRSAGPSSVPTSR